MTWRNVVSAAAVVGLSGGAVVAGTLWQADTRTAVAADDATPAVREFLRAAQLVCPEVPKSGADVLVVGVSVPGIEGQDVAGEVTVEGGGSRKSVSEPGATALLDEVEETATTLVSAEGGLAPGLVTARVSADSGGEGKGLASSPCLTPAAETWLVGGTAGPGQRDVLMLMNPTATDSQVDLAAYSKGGPLDLTGQEGIVVPAGETRTVKLSALAPHVDELTVRVRTESGLIAAAIADDRMEGLTPMGSDLITGAGDPDRSVTLAAVPAGAGARELQIMVPGGDSGTVRLTALTESGELPLLEGQPAELTSGHLTVLDVTKALGGRAAAIRLDADVPVVAAVSASTAADEAIKEQRAAQVAEAEDMLKNARGEAERIEAEAALSKAETANAIDPGEDLAWFGPAPAVATAAVGGLLPDADATVLLTGTGGEATVNVGLLPASDTHANRSLFRKVRVPANTTVAVELDAPKGAASYTAVVTRASGPGQVHVSHVQSDEGRTLTGYALGPIPVWVPLPVVVPAYG